MKKLIVPIIIILSLTLIICTGCNNEPFNGEVEFNELSLTIPDTFVRDTTVDGYKQGVAKRWEKDDYKSIVTISKHEKYELTEETISNITTNQQLQMALDTVQAEQIEFLGNPALESSFKVTDGEMKYLVFSTDNYTYEFSVQGDISDYEQIRDSIKLK